MDWPLSTIKTAAIGACQGCLIHGTSSFMRSSSSASWIVQEMQEVLAKHRHDNLEILTALVFFITIFRPKLRNWTFLCYRWYLWCSCTLISQFLSSHVKIEDSSDFWWNYWFDFLCHDKRTADISGRLHGATLLSTNTRIAQFFFFFK